LSAVYGGDCVSDDYIETLTPETPVIDITTEISTDEMETAEKVTENVTTVDDVRPIIEEIAENITETNQNIPSEEGVYYEVIFKTRYLIKNPRMVPFVFYQFIKLFQALQPFCATMEMFCSLLRNVMVIQIVLTERMSKTVNMKKILMRVQVF
jgi:hypothetical protein